MSGRNWSNIVVDLTSVALPAIVGPFDEPADAVLVHQGASAGLWLAEMPISTDEVARFGTEWLYDRCIPLTSNGVFLPINLERWWLVATIAPASLTVLTCFRDIDVPATR